MRHHAHRRSVVVQLGEEIHDGRAVGGIEIAGGLVGEKELHIDKEADPEAYAQLFWHWVHWRLIALQVEIAEIHEAAQFKWWKEYDEPISRDEVRKETVDAFHFLLGLMLDLEMTPDDIVKAYDDKNQENFARQNGTSKQKDYST
jgi:dimeric dUTPase (all-alpha-NTP-PPase superfamily)